MPDPIREKIFRENEGRKRINGHSAEYISDCLGVPLEEVFSPELKTIYVGDPWQKLDLPGVTIVDYEYGPVVEFQPRLDFFIDRLKQDHRQAYWDRPKFSKVPEVEPNSPEEFLERNRSRVAELIRKSEIAPITEYPAISAEFASLRLDVQDEIRRETGEDSGDPIGKVNEQVRSLWYFATQGERIRDIKDAKEYVSPELAKFVATLPKEMSKKDRTKLIHQRRRELIESIRLKKEAVNADVVEAFFPELPFADESFDRFVAYYSISTYVFPSLDEYDFNAYWTELDRVLKDGAEAFIGPLYDSAGNLLWDTVNQYERSHPNIKFYDKEMPSGQMMLVVVKDQRYAELVTDISPTDDTNPET